MTDVGLQYMFTAWCVRWSGQYAMSSSVKKIREGTDEQEYFFLQSALSLHASCQVLPLYFAVWPHRRLFPLQELCWCLMTLIQPLPKTFSWSKIYRAFCAMHCFAMT